MTSSRFSPRFAWFSNRGSVIISGIPKGYDEKINVTFGSSIALLAELERLFEGGARLVTITGPGGTGKTRLGREYGRRHIAAGTGELWFVDLTRAEDPRDPADRELLRAAVDRLRRAGGTK